MSEVSLGVYDEVLEVWNFFLLGCYGSVDWWLDGMFILQNQDWPIDLT